ncbi:MAG: DUF3551 domain-containing protein [Bradyrhizobium sp.]|uniref:DUF3551 domain-containing protein n=1 Tax=Bradyrhizobium sp. TaxID=376 RepID=UPI001DA7E50F|nr:DUF3551 domain-containing protein [Bradyrhizobium sp.]MBV9558848.1 DUF3551 domain-containing protein [Bradyrhizobium sp.]
MKPLSRTMIVPPVKALLAIAVVATTVSKASAEDWCRINEHNLLSCGFASKEQCNAMTSGRTGYCDHNPFPGKPAAHHPIGVYSQAEYTACLSMKLDCGGGAFAYAPKTRPARN